MSDNVERRSSKSNRKRTSSTGEKARRGRRERRIEIRIGEDELRRLDTLCGEKHVTRSEYLRNAVMNPKGTVIYRQPRHSKEVDRLVDEANRIGVNMNQIARAMNATRQSLMSDMHMALKVMPQDSEIKKLRESVDKMTASVNSLRSAYSHELLERENRLDEFCDAFDEFFKDSGLTANEVLELYGGVR